MPRTDGIYIQTITFGGVSDGGDAEMEVVTPSGTAVSTVPLTVSGGQSTVDMSAGDVEAWPNDIRLKINATEGALSKSVTLRNSSGRVEFVRDYVATSTPALLNMGTTLTGSAHTFTWSDDMPPAGRKYQIAINGITKTGSVTAPTTSWYVNGLPVDGSQIAVELFYWDNDDTGTTLSVTGTVTAFVLHPSVVSSSVTKLSSTSLRLTIELTQNGPAQLQYRIQGSPTWINGPTEASSNYGKAPSPHQMTQSGLATGNIYEVRGRDQVNANSWTTQVFNVSMEASEQTYPASQSFYPNSTKPAISAPALSVAVSNGRPNQTIRRVSNDYEIHSYSKRPAISIDGQYVLLGNKVRKVSDGSLKATFSSMNTESVTSLADPDVVWGISGGNVHKGSIASGTSIVHMNALGGTLMGQWEGAISADDRYMVTDNGNNLKVLDLVSKTAVGNYTAGAAVNGFHISIDGAYVAWVEGGILRKATRSFTGIWNTGLSSSHSDFGVDVNGDQVYVHFSDSNHFKIVNMRTNTITQRNFGTGTGNGFISCRNASRPGWAYFTCYTGGRIMAIKLDYATNLTFEDWGHYRYQIDYENFDYYDLPKGTVSKDGRKILVTTTWDKTLPRRDYLVEFNG